MKTAWPKYFGVYGELKNGDIFKIMRSDRISFAQASQIAADLTRLQVWLKEFSDRKIPQPSASKS